MDKWRLYVKAYSDLCNKHGVIEGNPIGAEDFKKSILYCVKCCITRPETIDYEDAQSTFKFHNALKQMIGALTPVEFIEIFPIKKEYDGEKFGKKDYFETINYIKTLDPYKPIQDALTFMCNYHNDEIHKLNVAMIMNLSDLRRYEGEPSIAEEWANGNGISMQTMHTDNQGNQFLVDQEGRVQKVIKPKPRKPKYLKLVK